MPLFEYRCRNCSARYEALVSPAEHEAPGCPRCGAVEAERLISTFAVGRPRSKTRSTGPCGSADCACRTD